MTPAPSRDYVAQVLAVRLARTEYERDDLRDALEDMVRWADEAGGHYGVEECSGVGQSGTEWDAIQQGLRLSVLRAREVIARSAQPELSPAERV